MTATVVTTFDEAGQGPVVVDVKVVKISFVIEAIDFDSVAVETDRLGSLAQASTVIVAALVAAG